MKKILLMSALTAASLMSVGMAQADTLPLFALAQAGSLSSLSTNIYTSGTVISFSTPLIPPMPMPPTPAPPYYVGLVVTFFGSSDQTLGSSVVLGNGGAFSCNNASHAGKTYNISGDTMLLIAGAAGISDLSTISQVKVEDRNASDTQVTIPLTCTSLGCTGGPAMLSPSLANSDISCR